MEDLRRIMDLENELRDAQLQIQELKNKLDTLECRGQHMTCGACEQLREKGKQKQCQAKDMKPGQLYRLKDGEVVVFSRIGQTGMVIVHPPGESDMQSSSAIEPEYVVEEVAENQKCERDEHDTTKKH